VQRRESLISEKEFEVFRGLVGSRKYTEPFASFLSAEMSAHRLMPLPVTMTTRFAFVGLFYMTDSPVPPIGQIVTIPLTPPATATLIQAKSDDDGRAFQ
jgi:hypothetical protein